MKFGVREICDVVFKAKSTVKIGNKLFKKGQPVLYIDTAKTSTVEGAATTVYATGGKGNTRLIAWEGEKTLTFTVEDALLSPMGFAILSGAGLLQKSKDSTDMVHVHMTSTAYTETDVIDLSSALNAGEVIDSSSPIFVVVTEKDGSITGEIIDNLKVSADGKQLVGEIKKEQTVFVDYYVKKPAAGIAELQIDAEHFAGNYYVEASTLFRREHDGVDMPAEITLPNVKIQSNFTFTMASSGDPSTFTFTMDAFPGYTMFNPTKKVLCAIQILGDTEAKEGNDLESIFEHDSAEVIIEADKDNDHADAGEVSTKLTIPAQSEEWLGRKISDMITPNTYVDNTGAVLGTLNYIDSYKGFSSIPSDQSGYYFPFVLPVAKDAVGAPTKMSIAANGVVRPDKQDMAYDPEIILRASKGDKFSIMTQKDGEEYEEAISLSFARTDFVKAKG